MDRESCFNVLHLWSITWEARGGTLRDKATYFRAPNSAGVCNAIIQQNFTMALLSNDIRIMMSVFENGTC
jgi:hypothetical protein